MKRAQLNVLLFRALNIILVLILLYSLKYPLVKRYSILIFISIIVILLYLNKKYFHVGYLHPMKEFRKDKYQKVFAGKRPKPDKLAKDSRRIILMIYKFLVTIAFIFGIIFLNISAIIIFGILSIISWWDDINDYLKNRNKGVKK